MITCRSFLLCCFSLFALCMQAQPPEHTPRFSPHIDDNINGFWEYLPRNYNTDVTTKYPLLIFIHGAGEQGSVQDTPTINLVLRNGPPKIIRNGSFPDSFSVNGHWFKFIVISPQIKNGITGVTSTIQPSTIEAVIQYAINTYRVDQTRIYLCGLSMGGGATWDYAGSDLTAAKKLAGIIVAAGAADLSGAGATNIAEADLPVLATHNRNDNVIAVSRTEANIAQLLSAPPTLNPTPKAVYWDAGGHNVWSRTFENIVPGTSPGGNLADTLGVNAYEWMLQFFRPSLVLPVVWQSFTVRAVNGKALLQWSVSSQVDVKEYIVERSADGVQWVAVANVGLKNNFTDVVSSGYYRIKEVDKDGKFSYSPVKRLNGVAKVNIYPNPFVDKIYVEAGNELVIKLADASGKMVLKTNSNTVNATGLSAGTYYVTVHDKTGAQLYSGRLVKN
ncbi:MAG TPA: T9SS type A sorting domain-containing protein [Chitinophagaceae bacterium]|nr:T9SS type A sorting domain-containing protein [Chitinophagaceae bacterium]